jgi:hypothetical protein
LDALSVVSRADAIGAILQHTYIFDLSKFTSLLQSSPNPGGAIIHDRVSLYY